MTRFTFKAGITGASLCKKNTWINEPVKVNYEIEENTATKCKISKSIITYKIQIHS